MFFAVSCSVTSDGPIMRHESHNISSNAPSKGTTLQPLNPFFPFSSQHLHTSLCTMLGVVFIGLHSRLNAALHEP